MGCLVLVADSDRTRGQRIATIAPKERQNRITNSLRRNARILLFMGEESSRFFGVALTSAVRNSAHDSVTHD